MGAPAGQSIDFQKMFNQGSNPQVPPTPSVAANTSSSATTMTPIPAAGGK
jgi:hypothetical protein